MVMHGRVVHEKKKHPGRDRRGAVDLSRDHVDQPAVRLCAHGAMPSILSDRSLPAVQREEVATQVGQAQGNRYLSRVLAHVERTSPAQHPGIVALQRVKGPQPMQSRTREHTAQIPLLEPIRNRLSAKKYLSDEPEMPDPIAQNAALCRVLLTLYARMGDLWSLIPIGAIDWLDEKGSMDFVPADMDTFRSALTSRGYTASYFAKAADNLWGLREPNLPAAGLHIRGKRDGKVNVHIDLHPPSWTGFWHWFMDSFRRGSTHTPETLQAGVERLGVYIPVLYEQRIHGELTVLLNSLATKAKRNPAVQAEIDEGLDYLRQVGALLWNKPGISQEELSQAGWLLGLAGASASGAMHDQVSGE